jgi:hypothetical protein
MRSLKEKRQREGKREETGMWDKIRLSRIKTRNTEKNERIIRKRKGRRKRRKRGGWKFKMTIHVVLHVFKMEV